MQYHNQYSDFHHHQPEIPKGNDTKNHIKLWDLVYREKETLVSGQTYPVCKAKENSLVTAGTHGRIHFKIIPHK